MTTAALDTGQSSWEHHLPSAGLVVVVVGLLGGLPLVLGAPGVPVAVAVAQLALVAGWVVAAGLEGVWSSLGLGVAVGAAADLVLLLPARAQLGSLLGVFGVGFLAVVLQQMLRRRREELVASLSGALLLVCALCGLAALLLLGRTSDDRAQLTTAMLVVGAALLVGHVVDLVLPLPPLSPEVPRGLLGLVLAVAAAAGVAVLRSGVGSLVDTLTSVIFGTVLGAVAALIAVAASYVAADTLNYDRPPRRWSLPLVQAVLPVAACGPVALALLNIL